VIGRRWFLAHWFAGVFAILAVVWAITLVAYVLGAPGVSFRNRYTGQDATIDFDRKYDHTIVELSDQVGLQLDTRGPTLHAVVVALRPGIPVLCWVCGSLETAGGIAIVEYRQGDWLFRAPEDLVHNDQVLHGRAESRAFVLTIAYNRATHERVVGDADLAAQTAVLAARGLAVSERTRLTATAVADLAPLSIQREGCIIFNAAFIAVAILWLVLGGVAVLIARLLRRRRK
jgi:hypothetical protein